MHDAAIDDCGVDAHAVGLVRRWEMCRVPWDWARRDEEFVILNVGRVEELLWREIY